MFLEKNKNIWLLCKKVLNKKISTALAGDIAGNYDVTKLTDKEVEIHINTKPFRDFSAQLFSPEKLLQLLHVALTEVNMQEFLLLGGLKAPKYDDFAIRFIYESNKTEGSRIPIDQVEKIIQKKKYTYKVKNEIQEVKNSLLAWDFLQKDFKFTLAHIKRLYHILDQKSHPREWHKISQVIQKIPVVVNNQATTPPEKVDEALANLILSYKRNKNTTFPLQNAFDFHLAFEQIHPFENGNGRTGRLIMNKILIAAGLPPCIVFLKKSTSVFQCYLGSQNS